MSKNIDPSATQMMPMDWREFSYEQPPLGPNERYPRFLSTAKDVPVLANKELTGYIFVEEIDRWIPPNHRLMLDTIRMERRIKKFSPEEYRGRDTSKADLIYDDLSHATANGYWRGCLYPLCKRYHRQLTAERAHSTSILRSSSTEKKRKPRITGSDYDRMRTGSPAYASVDPLIVRFCIEEYSKKRSYGGSGVVETWFELANPDDSGSINSAKIDSFLRKKYGNYVLLD